MSERQQLIERYKGKIFRFKSGNTYVKVTRIANKRLGIQRVVVRILEASPSSKYENGEYVYVNCSYLSKSNKKLYDFI